MVSYKIHIFISILFIRRITCKSESLKYSIKSGESDETYYPKSSEENSSYELEGYLSSSEMNKLVETETYDTSSHEYNNNSNELYNYLSTDKSDTIGVKKSNKTKVLISHDAISREEQRLRSQIARVKEQIAKANEKEQIRRIRERARQVERQIKINKQRAAQRRKEFLRKLNYDRELMEAFEQILFEATSTTAAS
uniref:BZIP domain-containing protein n=1 Tax=Parastrongyloides trichosuri TaxID=131310 RepID=A0A0N4ZW39_PARTI